MNNTQNQTVVRSVALLGVAIALVVFLAGAYGPLPVASGQNPPPDQAPAATIDKIVINEKSELEALGNVIVTRNNGEKVQAVTTGLLLYRGDVIETAKNTKVTVLFLDFPVSEKHNQIIIDGDAKVGISSSDSWWGRTWVKVKGVFTSKTTYVQVGARGTEYEFNVIKGGRQAVVVMLEGDVDVTRGTFGLVGRLADFTPIELEPATNTPQFIPASFARESSGQQQPGRSLDVPAGQITTFEVTYSIFNECRQRHRFEFRSTDDTTWLQLDVQKTWDIAPAQRLEIKAKLNIDTRRLAAGLHQGHVYVVCLDCDREPQCPGAQLDWPYNLNVSGSGVITTPSPSPTVTTNFRLTELEEAVVPNSPDPAVPQRASDARVRDALDWTNRVILNTQPSYSAEGLFAHFSNVEERSQNFRTAREQVILRHLPGSNKRLGDVYSDWGQPALAVAAYDKEGKNPAGAQTPPESFSVDQAEARRLTGQLGQARDAILASADSRSAAAQNLLGNIYYDYARIDLDKRDWAQARTNLDQAERFYQSALSSLTQGRQRATAAGGAVQANAAKTQISQGDLILQEALPQAAGAPQTNAAQLARTKYANALQLLSNTQPAESTYPFGVQALGRAHHGLGDAAMLAGEPGAAVDSYANAKSHYNRIISAHPDCAEAYFSLGDLYDDLGDKENAKLNYRRAIQTRAEQPASYYPLAVLVQDEDPQLAKALAATYLKLEPEVFKQGEKARNAERIAGGGRVIRPTRPGEQVGKPLVAVPDVLNKTSAEANSALQNAGFTVRMMGSRSDARSKDVVIEQKPAARTEARRGSAIEIIVSSGPVTEAMVPVPDLLNKPEAVARAAIDGAGLRVGSVGRRNDSKAVGTVLEQRPAAGSSAARGSAIEIVVSLGSGQPPVVPDVLNMSLPEATTAIEGAGLKVGKVERKSDDRKPKGSVIKQDPSARKKASPGSVVDLTLSEGKLVDVPDIVKDKEQTASNEITGKGLTVGKITHRASCDLVDKVLDQNPKPTKVTKLKVEVGSAVDFVLGSVGENPVTVPNFVGGNRFEVEANIRERRFTVGNRPKTEETDDAPPGTVIKQSPPAGTQIARDCPVNIEITIAVPLITVGNYVGMSELEARRQLSAIGLSADVRYEQSRDNPGIVLRQSPPPDSRVRRGFPVALAVSVQPVKVPNVIGRSLEEARRILANAGLSVGRVDSLDDPRSDYPVGSVIRQDPNPEQIVPPRTRVNLVVRAAPRQPQDFPAPRQPQEFPAPRQPQNVTVPRVFNMPERDARVTIERVGLRVATPLGCIQANQIRGLGVGNAAGTNPVEGTSVAVGTPVTLFIGRETCARE
jgi:beta-lactam-binding protein with PASTA domain/tetratricopeptide (TPR) repeat protein